VISKNHHGQDKLSGGDLSEFEDGWFPDAEITCQLWSDIFDDSDDEDETMRYPRLHYTQRAKTLQSRNHFFQAMCYFYHVKIISPARTTDQWPSKI
jgi:hypothetical protein